MKKAFSFISTLCIGTFACFASDLMPANPMANDASHKAMDAYTGEHVASLTREQQITWLIDPDLTLNKADLISLRDGASVVKDGRFTIAHLTLIPEQDRNALKECIDSGEDLLLVRGYWDLNRKAFVYEYRVADSSTSVAKNKIMSVYLSDIGVKNPKSPIGKAIKKIIKHPAEDVEYVHEDKPKVIVEHTSPSTETVVIQQSAPQPSVVYAPAPAPSTVVVEERPVVREEVVIGPWFRGPGYYHERHRHW